MSDGIIIQARSGSTRLPSKILLPFDGGETILDIIIRNIIRDNPGIPVVVATTGLPADDVIAATALRHGVGCFRGSENDVLSRFIGAADRFGFDRIIRVCSDNPFLLTASFARLFEESDKDPAADYVAFSFPDGRPTIKSHLGLYAELATTDALRRSCTVMDGDPLAPLYREHVTICLYSRPDEFRLRLLPLPDRLSNRTDLRLTLDTPSDFRLLSELYRLYADTDRSLGALIGLVDSNPRYAAIMKQNIARNEK